MTIHFAIPTQHHQQPAAKKSNLIKHSHCLGAIGRTIYFRCDSVPRKWPDVYMHTVRMSDTSGHAAMSPVTEYTWQYMRYPIPVFTKVNLGTSSTCKNNVGNITSKHVYRPELPHEAQLNP
jgi:hypothetical protein